MRRKPETLTGRGLVWALRGEILLALGALSYSITQPGLGAFSLFVGAALVVGALSLLRMWRGRHEFGPDHERRARAATFLTVLAGSLVAMSILSFQTFPSASFQFEVAPANATAPDGNTTHKLSDLRPPIVLLAAGIAVETASGALFLWELVGQRWRRAAALYGALGLAGGLLVLRQGLAVVRDFEATLGPRADSLAQAQSYYRRFLDEFLPYVMLVIVATRVVAYVLVRRAIRKVLEAEADAKSAAPTEPASSP